MLTLSMIYAVKANTAPVSNLVKTVCKLKKFSRFFKKGVLPCPELSRLVQLSSPSAIDFQYLSEREKLRSLSPPVSVFNYVQMKSNLLLYPGILLLLTAFLFTSCSTTYYVVRHAEKRNNSDTSSLTDAGNRRAIALKALLADKRVTAAWATTYLRTQLTAKPLADANNLSIGLYRPDTTLQFANRLDRVKGSRMLIVGHSNTVGVIVKKLSGKTIPVIPENDFDNIYTVKTVRYPLWTTRSLTSGTYGDPSP